MTFQTFVIVFCIICLGVTMFVFERPRSRLGHKLRKVRRWLTRGYATKAFQVEWRKLPEMREPRFLV